jgi:hypothetical protein
VPSLLAYDYLTVSELALGNAIDAESGVTGRTAIAGTFYAAAEYARFRLPEPFADTLLMTDWTRDIIAAVEVGEDGALGKVTRLLPWETFRRPIDLDVGPDGALYVLEFGTDYGGNSPDAQVTRIEYSPTGDLSPVAVVSSSVASGSAPLTVQFSSAGSRAPGQENAIEAYEWDFDGDGNIDSREADDEFTFTNPGLYHTNLTVVSASGERSVPASTAIVVGNTPPQVDILSPEDSVTVDLDSIIELRGAATDLQDVAIDCSKLTWDIRLGHNAHAHPLYTLQGCDTSFRATLGGHNDGGELFLAVELTYTDSGGPDGETSLTGRDSIRINVR